ncbi:ribonuclease R [Fusibacter sp. JL216-2]|uniref:ribonuclease R n=1 Tax=Fusibacter sp. JL216-2 TaxID=3071453 RepID=UPI003D334A58
MNIQEKILDYLAEQNRPIADIDIAIDFEINKSEYQMFFSILEKMEEQGLVIKTKKKKYGLPEVFGMVTGRVQSTLKGFAFLIPEDKSVKDVFIPASELEGAMNDDIVMVKLTQKAEGDRRPEGTVIKIIERANAEVVGTFEQSKDFGFVLPDNRKINMDIYVPGALSAGAETGDKVVVKITKWPKGRRNPEGKVIEILGKKGDPGTDILSVIRKYSLPEDFPRKVLAAADNVPQEVEDGEIKRRKDLRDMTTITIDGADAKDLDDAVSIERQENGNFKLWVHIADVTHYVKEGSPLDKEALKRATSVYLVDRVIPMLPRRLSNGICSLNPKVDRLTMTCMMEIDQNGGVVDHEIFESVIKTNERMVYTDVSDILENVDRPELKAYEYLFDTFKAMEELSLILRKKRERRGAIDFNFPEAKIIVDEKGKPVEIKRSERRIANRIIEEFMLAANETVAEHMHWLDLPFVYRIHEMPDEEKIVAFNKFIHNFGFFVKGAQGELHPKAVQNLLEKVEGKPEERIISKMMLRSLKQAKYSPANEGHFGLAADYYCHFTSPIRRYPDLQIHRIIREMLQNKLNPKRIEQLEQTVLYASEQSSEQERVAEKAERETDDIKMCEYMLDYVGEEFEGLISSVTSFGVFTELDNTVEGLTRMNLLDDDYYYYDEENMQLVGERTKNTYRIGDRVLVRVERVNVDLREIDFYIVEKLSSAY